MSELVSDPDRIAFVRIVEELESAWNAGDGVAFGAIVAGRHAAMFSAVLTRENGAWSIASFHNTLAPPHPQARS